MRVRELLDVPDLGLRLLTDVAGMDRAILRVYTTDLPDPSRYLTQGDLVLTGLIWCRTPGDADRFVSALARAGVAALGAGEALGKVPDEVLQACGRHGLPLLAVPAETSFAAVTEEVGRRLSRDRATEMTRVLGRRRLLLSAVAEGAGLDAMFRLMSRELGAECRLLTGLGRVIGGTGPSLPQPLALRLACEYLRAGRMPVTEVSVAGEGAGTYSLFGVGGEPRITGWFLACAGSEQDWPHELRESVAELAADVALERARLNAARTGDGKLAEAIVTMLASGGGDGAAPAEIASLIRAAGLPSDGRYLVAAVTAEADRVTGPNAERWRCDLAAQLACQAHRGGQRAGRERDCPARRTARGRQRAAAGRPARHLGRLGRDQRRGDVPRAPAGHRSGQRAALVPRAPARPAAGLRRPAPGRAAADATRVPGLLRIVERMRGQDVRPRQHRPLPDQADRGADRARPVPAGRPGGLLPRPADSLALSGWW